MAARLRSESTARPNFGMRRTLLIGGLAIAARRGPIAGDQFARAKRQFNASRNRIGSQFERDRRRSSANATLVDSLCPLIETRVITIAKCMPSRCCCTELCEDFAEEEASRTKNLSRGGTQPPSSLPLPLGRSSFIFRGALSVFASDERDEGKYATPNLKFLANCLVSISRARACAGVVGHVESVFDETTDFPPSASVFGGYHNNRKHDVT